MVRRTDIALLELSRINVADLVAVAVTIRIVLAVAVVPHAEFPDVVVGPWALLGDLIGSVVVRNAVRDQDISRTGGRETVAVVPIQRIVMRVAVPQRKLIRQDGLIRFV